MMRARVEGQLAAWRSCIAFHTMMPAISTGMAMKNSAMMMSPDRKIGARASARPPTASHQKGCGRRSGPDCRRNQAAASSRTPNRPATAAATVMAVPAIAVVRSPTGVVRRRISTESVPSPSFLKVAAITTASRLACSIASLLLGARTVSRLWRTLVWLGSDSRVASAAWPRIAASKARVTRASSRSLVVASSTVAAMRLASHDGTVSRNDHSTTASRSSPMPSTIRLPAKARRAPPEGAASDCPRPGPACLALSATSIMIPPDRSNA